MHPLSRNQKRTRTPARFFFPPARLFFPRSPHAFVLVGGHALVPVFWAMAADSVADSTEGFTLVLAGLKALLEHNVRLNLVADRHPNGTD